MEPLDARYPFLASARSAVRESGVELATLVATEDPVVDRAGERVERALLEGTTESETPREWSAREELLSYPVARILVSLLEADAAVEKYALAEAKTAHDRFRRDFDRDDRRGDRIDRQTLLREFDLAGRCRAERPPRGAPEPQWFRLEVGAYLDLLDPAWGDDWRLVNRELADGEVRIEREELYRLLRAAVETRVAEGLPFDGVGDPIATELEREVADLRALLADRTGTTDVERVVPELFPPCLAGLLERVRRGESVSPQARFALVSFLVAIGLDSQAELLKLTQGGIDVETLDETVATLRDRGGSQYPPPSCATLSAYGVCENTDDHRSVAGHPLDYYERRLREADDPTDWRDREPAT
ncbi:MAG: eukaryotic-type DNA primase, large subunit [halophilic archaeon J07HB67]|nr:MAG: eukaryotic-type DNA primase, large subunit [halophilic archaeon J07HB67]